MMALKLISVFVICVCVATAVNGGIRDVLIASQAMKVGSGNTKAADPASSYSKTQPTFPWVNSLRSALVETSGQRVVNNADPTQAATPPYTGSKPTSTSLKNPEITAASVPLSAGTGGVKPTSSSVMEALNTAGGIKSADPTTVKGLIAPIGSTSASSSVNGADPTKTYTNTKPTPTLIKEPAIVKPPQHNHDSPPQPNTNIRQMLPLPEQRVTSPTTKNVQQTISAMRNLLSLLRSVQQVSASGTTNVATKTTNAHANNAQPSNVAGIKPTYSNYPQHHTQNAKPPQPELANRPVRNNTKPAHHTLMRPSYPSTASAPAILPTTPIDRASGTTNVATKTTNVHSHHAPPSNVAGTKRTHNYHQYRPAPQQPPYHTQNAKPPQVHLPNPRVRNYTKPAYHSNHYYPKSYPLTRPSYPSPASTQSLPPTTPIDRASGTTNVATKTTHVHSHHAPPNNVAGTKRTHNYHQYRPAPQQPPFHTQNANLPNPRVRNYTKPTNNYYSKANSLLLRHRIPAPASAQTLPPAKPTICRNQESHEQYPKMYFTEREKRVFLREVNEEREDVDFASNMNVVVSLFILFSSLLVKTLTYRI
ncbi:hypothetical protein SNE40_005031 [Patella caerulea]|uniref:Uncharacterized protein n=1 Tax=Patella caerulea TaxID=87958 RepID=A0AAN8Q6B7_PATCE